MLALASLMGFLHLAARPAHAADPDQDLFLRAEDLRRVFFGSLDAGRSVFASGGLKQSLGTSLDRTGFVFTQSFGEGITHERLDAGIGRSATRYTTQTASMLGYQLAGSGLYLAGFAGPELGSEQVVVDDRIRRLSRPRLGLRVQGELWANPTSDTLLTANLVAGTAQASVWARVAAGYRLWENLFVGPEATLYGTPSYSEWRVGIHLTGLDLGLLHFRFSGGYMQEGEGKGSPYLGITSWIRL